jgi:serine/threonine protein kinase/ActR/RegA family two-component response regulator
MKILIAEDNLFYRRMLETLLKEWGYTVVTVTNGEAAWEALQQPDAPRLAILNWMMPRMDGLEVCRRIRELKLTEPPYLIILSARNDREQIQTALASGANDYITKPFDRQELRMRLQVGHGFVGMKSTDVTYHASTRSASSTSAGAITPPSGAPAKSGSETPVVAGYEILTELGRGGMSVVYKARHIHMDRLVALKVINQEFVKEPDAMRRFHQEVRAAAQLFHPNIVMAFDAGQVGATHYLAMEYVVGIDLAKLVRQRGPLPVDQACNFMRQAALGLQHAHEKGLVHRDIKPSNLLVTGITPGEALPTLGPDVVVKILDMGLALLYRQPLGPTGAAAELTGEGKWMGTIDYMAPEQWKNAHRVDIRADLYSLGCTFYHLLTGQVPFPDEGFGEKMLKHYLEEPIPLEQLRADVPPAVVGVIRQLMAKQPEHRYQTPAELAAALQQLN